MAIHSISLSPLGEAGYTAQMTLLNANYAAAYAAALAQVQAENAAIDAQNKANGTNTPHMPDPDPAIVLTVEQVIAQDAEWAAKGYRQADLNTQVEDFRATLTAATPAEQTAILSGVQTAISGALGVQVAQPAVSVPIT